MPKSCKESKGKSRWVGVNWSGLQHQTCVQTSYLQFVKGLVGVWVLQFLELENLERSPRHYVLVSEPDPRKGLVPRLIMYLVCL